MRQRPFATSVDPRTSVLSSHWLAESTTASGAGQPNVNVAVFFANGNELLARRNCWFWLKPDTGWVQLPHQRQLSVNKN